MVARFEPLLTVEVLDLMPDDGNIYELIDGELTVSRAPGLKHQQIVSRIIVIIEKFLEDTPSGILVPGPGVLLSNFSGVIPGLVYLTHDRRKEIATGEKITGSPNLVIEIISPGADNALRDREIKRQLYAKYHVPEYWIFDPETQSIEVYRLKRKSLHLVSHLKDEDTLKSPLFPGFEVPARQFFKLP
ncbi:MAG: Uma2 family endonuclease [Acidobacteria bacterium]|nr:Uma2 family endonuclease [Acidobacteriota bacterium]